MNTIHNNNKLVIDPAIFWPAIIAILAASIPLAMYPEAGKAAVNAVLAGVRPPGSDQDGRS